MIQLLKKLFGKPTPQETRQQLLNKYYDAKKDADYGKMRDIANRLYNLGATIVEETKVNGTEPGNKVIENKMPIAVFRTNQLNPRLDIHQQQKENVLDAYATEFLIERNRKVVIYQLPNEMLKFENNASELFEMFDGVEIEKINDDYSKVTCICPLGRY